MSVWADITGLVERDSTGNAATRRGQIMESAIRDEAARRLGTAIVPGPKYEDDPRVAPAPYEFAHCREDGLHFDTATQLWWVDEVKTVRDFAEWGDDGSAEIPAYYMAQVLWQMIVCSLLGYNIGGCKVWAFCPMTDDLREYTIEFDAERGMKMLEVVGDWYRAHVVGNVPPPSDGSEATRKVLARLYPGGIEKVVIDATSADVNDKQIIQEANNEIATIEIRRDAAKARLMERIGQNGATHIRGVCAWSPVKPRTSFDSKAALAADPSLSRFQTVGEPSRRFTLTEK